MGLDKGLLKKLLLVACILGVLQGLLTFIGGLVACFDRDKDVRIMCTVSWTMVILVKVLAIMKSVSKT